MKIGDYVKIISSKKIYQIINYDKLDDTFCLKDHRCVCWVPRENLKIAPVQAVVTNVEVKDEKIIIELHLKELLK